MLTICLILSLPLQAVDAQDESATPAKLGATPEQALRSFFLAMLTKDEATLRAITVPNDGFELLLGGQEVPADQIDTIKARLVAQPIRVLEAGDEIRLPNGRVLTIRPEDVSDTRALLQPEGSPLPVRCEYLEGRWRIDASPIIGARKAAAALRAQAEPPRP